MYWQLTLIMEWNVKNLHLILNFYIWLRIWKNIMYVFNYIYTEEICNKVYQILTHLNFKVTPQSFDVFDLTYYRS